MQEKFELAVEQWLVVNASDTIVGAVPQSEGFRQRSRLSRRKRTRVVESLRNAALYTLEWAAKIIFTIPDRLIKGKGGSFVVG